MSPAEAEGCALVCRLSRESLLTSLHTTISDFDVKVSLSNKSEQKQLGHFIVSFPHGLLTAEVILYQEQ